VREKERGKVETGHLAERGQSRRSLYVRQFRETILTPGSCIQSLSSFLRRCRFKFPLRVRAACRHPAEDILPACHFSCLLPVSIRVSSSPREREGRGRIGKQRGTLSVIRLVAGALRAGESSSPLRTNRVRERRGGSEKSRVIRYPSRPPRSRGLGFISANQPERCARHPRVRHFDTFTINKRHDVAINERVSSDYDTADYLQTGE